METKHTEGPWYFDGHGAIWRRPPSDLYENGGGVAGDRPIATVHIGWHHDEANGYPVEANARLMTAAPELLDELEYARTTLSLLRTDVARSAKVDHRWGGMDEKFAEWLGRIDAAIAKARGETC